MATDIKLPELGEGVSEGELIKWLVQPGDSVKADQPIAEVMTDKATVEVPTPISGTVKELKFNPGQLVKVDAVMITLDASGAGATAKPVPASQELASKPVPAATSPANLREWSHDSGEIAGVG